MSSESVSSRFLSKTVALIVVSFSKTIIILIIASKGKHEISVHSFQLPEKNNRKELDLQESLASNWFENGFKGE